MERFIARLLCVTFLTMTAGCACCQKPAPAAPKPVEEPTPAPPESVSAPAPPTAPQNEAQPPKRILGLDEGWQLAPGGAKYSATQANGEVVLRAKGEHLTGGFETKLVMSPLRIYPPQWMLAVREPSGPATFAITPYDVTASFKANEPVEALHVSDAAGKHIVPVEQARD